jgi:Protein of unknown function (DUF3800)
MDYVCFIDEAGCPGALASASAEIQPVFLISGLFIEQKNITPLTKEFLDVKRKYFPKLLTNSTHDLNHLLHEIKGADDLRKPIRKKGKHATAQLRFIDDVLGLLVKYDVKLFSRIWVKGIAKPFKGMSIYTITIHHLFRAFNDFLAKRGCTGIAIADFRNLQLNSPISHTILTRKLKASGDEFPNILELPVFGHSQNHAMLQIADVISSTILFPMATHTFCNGHVRNRLLHPRDGFFKIRFSRRIKNLQVSYSSKGRRHHGISVDDGLEKPKRTAGLLFK